MSRLQPGIKIPFPSRSDELEILRYALPFSDLQTLDLCVEFLQRAHGLDLPYSLRDGINAIRYALKLRASSPDGPPAPLFEQALRQVLGDEALDLEKQAVKRRQSGEVLPAMRLGDFFFPDDAELNPDSDEEV
jgi:MoxR-like ATPase